MSTSVSEPTDGSTEGAGSTRPAAVGVVLALVTIAALVLLTYGFSTSNAESSIDGDDAELSNYGE